MKKELTDKIVKDVASLFPSFRGDGRLSGTYVDMSPMFAAGVPILDVVEVVAMLINKEARRKANELKRKQNKKTVGKRRAVNDHSYGPNRHLVRRNEPPLADDHP